jgi:acetyltransferase-like isoleucine patch superfamily enzyme
MRERLEKILMPVAKRVMRSTIQPIGPARLLYQGLFRGQVIGREAYEWGWRALVASPIMLSMCERHGDRISVDRIPYVSGRCRIEIGSNVRISGQIIIHASSRGPVPVLRIGDGVFIGNKTCFTVASRIEIGNYSGIGSGSFISDTEAHARYGSERKPAWETPAEPGDIDPVFIEDGVWIGRNVAILKGVRVGEGSVIGYGSVVRSSVAPRSMVVGNPARNIPIHLFRKGVASTASAG